MKSTRLHAKRSGIVLGILALMQVRTIFKLERCSRDGSLRPGSHAPYTAATVSGFSRVSRPQREATKSHKALYLNINVQQYKGGEG
jgi:hypothetical protein